MRMPSHVCAPREYSSAGHSRGQAMSSSLNMSLEGQETQDTSHGCESEGSSESSSSGLASSGPSSSRASGTSTGSVLSLLKCPPPSHLARKRKTVTVGVKRSRGGTSTQILKSSDRVRQYTGCIGGLLANTVHCVLT